MNYNELANILENKKLKKIKKALDKTPINSVDNVIRDKIQRKNDERKRKKLKKK